LGLSNIRISALSKAIGHEVANAFAVEMPLNQLKVNFLAGRQRDLAKLRKQ
jgi:hypothetical protein